MWTKKQKNNMECIEEIELKDEHVLKIYPDDNCYNPREEQDNIGIMAAFHNKYDLGDKVTFGSTEFACWEDMEKHIINRYNPVVILPLYMYDHGGITISTSPFDCDWDSGQIGFVYTHNKHLQNMGTCIEGNESWSDFTDRISEYLESEIVTYDQYVRGDVYYYEIVNDEGEIVDSCSGFYGSDWKKNGILDYVGELAKEGCHSLGEL